MTSVRESLRRRFRTAPDAQAQRADFAYVVYWTKTARGWDPERRAATLTAVREILGQPGFVPTTYERRYRLPDVDSSAHAGASLVALERVLRALESP